MPRKGLGATTKRNVLVTVVVAAIAALVIWILTRWRRGEPLLEYFRGGRGRGGGGRGGRGGRRGGRWRGPGRRHRGRGLWWAGPDYAYSTYYPWWWSWWNTAAPNGGMYYVPAVQANAMSEDRCVEIECPKDTRSTNGTCYTCRS